ncbi:MAG: hypothetical protein R2784_19860 [Saprospiraceae bacterium]
MIDNDIVGVNTIVPVTEVNVQPTTAMFTSAMYNQTPTFLFTQ